VVVLVAAGVVPAAGVAAMRPVADQARARAGIQTSGVFIVNLLVGVG
jgi:hypothetical protein